MKHPFGVSSNTRTHTLSVFTRIDHDGIHGYGEACLPEYLGETLRDTLAYLEKAKLVMKEIQPLYPNEHLWQKFEAIAIGCNAAKAAVQTALLDLTGKLNEKPVYDLLKFGKSEPRETSFTIGIDNEEMVMQKIEEAKEFHILKIKTGTKDDKALISSIRKFTDKPLYVDVNQGWNEKERALDLIHWMKEQNILLIEQPMPVNMLEETAWLNERSPLPVIADESVKRLKDIEKVKGVFSGINIKLMKSGGLLEALDMCDAATENGMKIMLGCMAESSCATSAMAQLMQFADYVDLDAPNLISNDPFEGVRYENGSVILNEWPGIGVKPKIDLHFED